MAKTSSRKATPSSSIPLTADSREAFLQRFPIALPWGGLSGRYSERSVRHVPLKLYCYDTATGERKPWRDLVPADRGGRLCRQHIRYHARRPLVCVLLCARPLGSLHRRRLAVAPARSWTQDLAHRFLLELSQSHDQQQYIKKSSATSTAVLANAGIVQTDVADAFLRLGINQRVDQHGFLQDRKSLERAPRIVGATERRSWRNHHAEHQPNVLLIDAASQGQPSAAEKIAISIRMTEKVTGQPMLISTPGRSTSHASGITISPATSACSIPAKTFSIAIQRDTDRGQQPIFDFAGPLELGDERHRHGPNSSEDHADRRCGEQKALVRCRQKTAAHHHPAKNENKEQRLQESLQKELESRYAALREHRAPASR